MGYKTKELPAFYTRKSGLNVDYQIDSPKEAAEIIKAKRDMKLDGGILITNPIPEEYAMNEDEMNKAIDEALKEADMLGIKGKETTPFLLAKIKDITNGVSLESNIKLVYNNALVGSMIAKELSKME